VNYNWPPKIPKYSSLKDRALVTQVENEYLKDLKETKKIPIVNTGDIVEVTNYLSMSTLQTSTFKGICIGKRRKNTINSSLNILGAVEGVHMEMHIKVFSPMVKEIKVVEAGSGNYRSRLNYIRDFPITEYKALKRSGPRKQGLSAVAKKTENEMRQKVIKGVPVNEEMMNN
jgi:ribosomal protein L19